MDSTESPSDLVEILLAGDNPSVKQWEQVQRLVDSGAAPRDDIRSGLDGDRERRWATAVVLARLGASDGDDLALLVLSEFDLGVIPDPPTTTGSKLRGIYRTRSPKVADLR